ncbi:dual specificity protein phosphatase 16 [Scophthalmus maximus]|uniref:dual specificity protein phosphatase 16 n=1 Tax=Scophthalmus maximus TaxID=52904 RepID=UPI001FA87FEE|nr:dual specificity protein phosphatase 16 [Scophthalmus maximus]
MVWSRGSEAERPPLSAVLPRLYLGAEGDVVQERLASLGISYVLSVSRCSPQPPFLPQSRYLRIPIDDSLRDDLLPWIPQALRFIDAAMSSGASVLVHCAAGVSRSPALAVAYIMYSLGMDLDRAYRFVKERRPSISPNFNFLGQLQLFQGTLSQTASGGGGDLLLQQLDSCLPSIIDSVRHHHASQKVNCEAESAGHTDGTQQSHTHSDGNGNQQRSRSGKRLTLHLTLNQNQQEVRTSREALAPSPHRQVKPVPKPMQLQLPSDSASLLEKRKSLTLSLTPLESSSPATESGSQRARGATSSKTVHDGETGGRKEAKTQRSPVSYKQAEVHEQGPLSPFSLTLNKLLGWGERVLLGGVSVHPALPYRG